MLQWNLDRFISATTVTLLLFNTIIEKLFIIPRYNEPISLGTSSNPSSTVYSFSFKNTLNESAYQ